MILIEYQSELHLSTNILERIIESARIAVIYKHAPAAEHGLSSELGVDGCRIKNYSAYNIESYPFPNYYSDSQDRDKLRFLLQASGAEGKKAFLEHKPLSSVETYSLRVAQIPVNHEAREYFRDKEYAISITTRPTKKQSARPYFLHYAKSSVVPGSYSILPLDLKVNHAWSTASASEQSKNLRPMQQIKGQLPLHELLEGSSKHENLFLHPTQEIKEASSASLFRLDTFPRNAGYGTATYAFH